jgi:hypothetical protein
MTKFLYVAAAMLQLEEMGVLRQNRASNGELVWSASKGADEILKRNHARRARAEARAVARRRPAIKKGLELEIEIDDKSILLVREDELPIKSDILDALEMSIEELLTLFETATTLLADNDPDGHMRAYVAQDANGDWQVKLLPKTPF